MAEALLTPRQKLERCVERLGQGSWRFIQLRGEPLGAASIGGDDVDLLGSRESVETVILAAFEWAREGDCHLRITARDSAKTCLSLISMDGVDRLDLDLWMDLWQIDQKKSCLRFHSSEKHALWSGGSIGRFPLEMELAVYLHHLVSKRKDLSAESPRRRLTHYSRSIKNQGNDVLSEKIDRILRDQRVDDSLLAAVDPIIAPLRCVGENAGKSKINGSGSWWLSAPRTMPLISVMGCDGAGKTTLAKVLVEQKKLALGVLTGKHLYRKSFIYKLSVIFIRPLLFQSREKYDETLAPLVYLRACFGLRVKLWKHRTVLRLIDRTLMDFLMVDRKQDVPKFSRFRFLSKWFGARVPVIHCVLPFAKVMERKNEVTEAGHDAYDRGMFRAHAFRIPTDYVVFNNSGDLDESVDAADRVIRWMRDS